MGAELLDLEFEHPATVRLCAQTKIADHVAWSQPRVPTLDEIVAALHELSYEKRKQIGERLIGCAGLQERLQRAEAVVEAMLDASHAMKLVERYYEDYPDAKTPPF
jgi:hypothetical protein